MKSAPTHPNGRSIPAIIIIDLEPSVKPVLTIVST